MWFESARWIRKRGSCSWLNNLGQQIGWQNVRRSEAIFNIALQFGVTMALLDIGDVGGDDNLFPYGHGLLWNMELEW